MSSKKSSSNIDVSSKSTLRLQIGPIQHTFYRKASSSRVSLADAIESIETLVYGVVDIVGLEARPSEAEVELNEALDFMYSSVGENLNLIGDVVASLKTSEQLLVLQNLDWSGMEVKDVLAFIADDFHNHPVMIRMVKPVQDQILNIIKELGRAKWKAQVESANQKAKAQSATRQKAKIKEARKLLEGEGFKVTKLVHRKA